MRFDWTLNVPLLLAIIGVGVGVVARFARLETMVDLIHELFSAHEKSDEEHFGRMESRIDRLFRGE